MNPTRLTNTELVYLLGTIMERSSAAKLAGVPEYTVGIEAGIMIGTLLELLELRTLANCHDAADQADDLEEIIR